MKVEEPKKLQKLMLPVLLDEIIHTSCRKLMELSAFSAIYLSINEKKAGPRMISYLALKKV